MKKIICFMLSTALAVSFVGCGNDTAAADDTATAQTEITADNNLTDGSASTADTEDMFNLEDADSTADPTVDLDLTSLSSTMIYSEVFNMMMAPGEYEGKKVKMSGSCASYKDEETGKIYYACIVQDATQCCSQGLEFVLSDEYSDDDYPADGTEITIKGTFSTYTEGDAQYLTMVDAVLE